MRFGRLQCDGDGTPLGLEDLARPDELDLLQLDYPRPLLTSVEGGAPAELPDVAIGFIDALQVLAKTLYLDPALHVVASAGWGDAYACVERAATILVEAGCGELPLAAVRGSNLLPILDMIEDEGISLNNAETGHPWRELKAPILAADLQLGAGPLALALAEKARIIVAGAFDPMSPLIAASVHAYHWKWHDYDYLAAAVAASRAAGWVDWQASSGSDVVAWRPNRVEVDSASAVHVELHGADSGAAERLEQWLRELHPVACSELHADVRERCSTLRCSLTAPGRVAITGAQGSPGDDCWQLEILYESGFAVEALWEFSEDADRRWQQRLAATARRSLHGGRDDEGLLTVEELHGVSGGKWVHLAFQSRSRTQCQLFADQLTKLTAAHTPRVRLTTGRPTVHVHCGRWPVRVPRDAVDIAVETRVAREWT
jgi:hypothetical protein